MQKMAIAVGLAGLLLAAGYATASAAIVPPPAKTVNREPQQQSRRCPLAALLARPLGANALPMVLARPLGSGSLQLKQD